MASTTRRDAIDAIVATSADRLAAISSQKVSPSEKQAAIATEQAETAQTLLRYKAEQAHAAVTVPSVIDLGGKRQAHITSAEVAGDALQITVSVIENGKDVTPESLNPWIIVNPPMLVSDPAGDVEIVGDAGQKRMFREDPEAAIADIVRRNLVK